MASKKSPTKSIADPGSDAEIEEPVPKIKVAVQGCGQNLFFAFKPTTKMRKIKEMFHKTSPVALENLRFYMDGVLIKDNDTPLKLGLTDTDVIEVVNKSDGGHGSVQL